MKRKIRKLISLIITCTMILAVISVSVEANAVDTNKISSREKIGAYSVANSFNTGWQDNKLKNKFNSMGEYFLSLDEADVSVLGSEWIIMDLARADKISEEFALSYYDSVAGFLRKNGSSKLDTSKSTENSKVIIALASIGVDARNIYGYNLLEPLTDFKFVKKQGINGPIWALIAFDTLGYEITADNTVEEQTTREKLIEYILEKQLENGGWCLIGSTVDPDMTGMAINALAPYYNTNKDVKSAIDKALAKMSELQNEDGGFLSWGVVAPESCAQMITALTSLGIDPETDERFIKNGNTIFDAMMSFATDNGFSHTSGGCYNQITSEQAFYALTSYFRLKENKTSLYDMSDVKIVVPYDINRDGKFDVTDCTELQKYLVGSVSFDEEQTKDADCDGNTTVSITDVTFLQMKLAGII